MDIPFVDILAIGGKTNSLGEAANVIEEVLQDNARLDELYACLFHHDPWVRMRAADSLEKICRIHPDWLQPYVDRFLNELSDHPQPSIQWHLAQIYAQVELTDEQKQRVISWLKRLLASTAVDWIVAANAMETLAAFTEAHACSADETVALLTLQKQHASKAVVKRAAKLLANISLG